MSDSITRSTTDRAGILAAREPGSTDGAAQGSDVLNHLPNMVENHLPKGLGVSLSTIQSRILLQPETLQIF